MSPVRRNKFNDDFVIKPEIKVTISNHESEHTEGSNDMKPGVGVGAGDLFSDLKRSMNKP